MNDGRVGRLLADPKKWTKGTFAADKDGRSVKPHDSEACSFCLMGAVKHAYPLAKWETAFNALRTELPATWGIIAFNDTATYEEVIDVVRKAGI